MGRERLLTQIRRALLSPGRHVFIYGERGVGKTSLARTGRIAALDNKNFIYLPCGERTTFFEVIGAVGNSVVDLEKRIGSQGRGLGIGINLPGGIGGANFSRSPSASEALPVPTTMTEAFDLLRYVRTKLQGQIIVGVDELDRVEGATEKNLFAELLKNVGSQVDDVRFILCGIGANVDEVLGQHLSTGRMFEPVEVNKLSYDKLWQIIGDAAEPLGVSIDSGYLLRIGIISDGFPHFVHLIGECLLYAMHDDAESVIKCERRHFEIALREALQKAEPSLRNIYRMATEKTKNKLDYEEALWALADRTATRRQIKDIYDNSYLRIVGTRPNRHPLPRERLEPAVLDDARE